MIWYMIGKDGLSIYGIENVKHIRRLKIILSILVVLMVACDRQSDTLDTSYLPTATVPVINHSLPATQFFQEAQATIDARVTASFEETQALATQTAVEQLTQENATAEMHSQETAQAMPMFTIIEQLYDAGVLTATQGTYYHLPDFEEQWAFRDYYDFLITDYIVSDFVLQSKVEWESSGTNVDYWNNGCGFVFRLNARGDHYLVFLGSDGRVYLYLASNHNLEQIGRGRFSDRIILDGSATILLSALADRITLSVNDIQILEVTDPSLSTGYLGHAIASGTNWEFGTLCRMTNSMLWNLETP